MTDAEDQQLYVRCGEVLASVMVLAREIRIVAMDGTVTIIVPTEYGKIDANRPDQPAQHMRGLRNFADRIQRAL